MKRMLEIAIVAIIATWALSAVPVCASEMDTQIESSAKNLYVFKTFLKGDDVTIQSKDGVVSLTGTVSNEPRKILAQEAIMGLPDVKSVNNELKIKGDAPVEKSDGWLAVNVKSVLLVHRSVSGLNTEVNVKDGIVTLRGEADNQAQKQLTGEYAEDVDGVKEVKNEMTVADAPKKEKETIGEKIDDASITAQIKFSLLFHRSTRVLKTQIKTQDGVVTVSGMAKNAAEKDLVTKRVNDINGVTKVDNQMTIANPPQ